MTVYRELHTSEDLKQMWEGSLLNPIVLFKHSTTCPISAKAYDEFKSFLEKTEENVDSYMVKVIEDREISNQIAAETNVKHESPQIFLINKKEVMWNTSHSKITLESIENALHT